MTPEKIVLEVKTKTTTKDAKGTEEAEELGKANLPEILKRSLA